MNRCRVWLNEVLTDTPPDPMDDMIGDPVQCPWMASEVVLAAELAAVSAAVGQPWPVEVARAWRFPLASGVRPPSY